MGLFSAGFVVGVALIVLTNDNISSAAESDVLNPENKQYVIPEWVKGNAHWWSQGHLTDKEFSLTMQYLIDEEIITVKNCKGGCIGG